MARGGTRQGAGRKPLPEGEGTRPTTLHLTEETRQLWRVYLARSGKSADAALRELLDVGGESLLLDQP